MSLRLLTLGSPRVFRGHDELVDLPAQRLRFALLVYLAVEGVVARELVLSLFWPDRDAARARHALRQMLYELRQLLGEDWVEVTRDRIVVRAEIDAVAFERAAADDRVEDALALYGGPFMDGFVLENHAFEGWLDRQRAHLGRRHRRLCRDRIVTLLAAGDVEAALRVAQRWVDLDPLEDEASHTLIRCLALTGQRLAALQYYETYERQLAAELQVEPLDETRALVERIRAGDVIDPADGVVATGPAPGSPVDDATAANVPVPGAGMPSSQPPAGVPSQPPAAVPSQPQHAALTPAGPAATAASRAVSSQPPSPSRRRETWTRGLVAAAVAIAVLTVGALAYRGDRPNRPVATTTRVLVLPFADRSQDSSLVGLAGVLTEELTRNLSLSRPLDVISSSGVTSLREHGVSADSLRRLLRADYLVNGSVSLSADSVRVAVELLDGRTGSLIRSEVLERPIAQSRVLVSDVIERTAIFLRREVGNQVEVRRVRAEAGNDEAWRLVLEAHAVQDRLTRLFRHGDFAGILRVMDHADSLLVRAGELDRRWSEPLIIRGWIMERRALISGLTAPADTASKRKLLEAARSLGDRAAEREPQEARAYELRGAVLHQLAQLRGVPRDSARARLAAAERELRRATELDPHGPSAHRRRAELLFTAGSYAAAKNAAERAWEIDRYVTEAGQVITLLFATSIELNEDADARRWCAEGRRTLAQQPPFVYCLFALHAWADGVPPDPRLLRHELQQLDTTKVMAQTDLRMRLELMLAAVHARAGQHDSARAILRRTPTNASPNQWLRAAVHTALGDDATALSLLAEYIADGDLASERVARSRPFHRFHGRPEYERLFAM
jgi:DNA-binding SARP family transcriptional activator/TolB-like protein